MENTHVIQSAPGCHPNVPAPHTPHPALSSQQSRSPQLPALPNSVQDQSFTSSGGVNQSFPGDIFSSALADTEDKRQYRLSLRHAPQATQEWFRQRHSKDLVKHRRNLTAQGYSVSWSDPIRIPLFYLGARSQYRTFTIMPCTNLLKLSEPVSYSTTMFAGALMHLTDPTVINTDRVAAEMRRPALEVHKALTSIRDEWLRKGLEIKFEITSASEEESKDDPIVYLDDEEYVEELFINTFCQIMHPTTIAAVAVSEYMCIDAYEAYCNLVRIRHKMINQGFDIQWIVSAEGCGQDIDEYVDNFISPPPFPTGERQYHFCVEMESEENKKEIEQVTDGNIEEEAGEEAEKEDEEQAEDDEEDAEKEAEEDHSGEQAYDSDDTITEGNASAAESSFSSPSSCTLRAESSPGPSPAPASAPALKNGTKRKASTTISQGADKKPKLSSARPATTPARARLPVIDGYTYHTRTDYPCWCLLCPPLADGTPRQTWDRLKKGPLEKRGTAEKHIRKVHPEVTDNWEEYVGKAAPVLRHFRRRVKPRKN